MNAERTASHPISIRSTAICKLRIVGAGRWASETEIRQIRTGGLLRRIDRSVGQTTETSNAESRTMETFESVPDDAQQVLRVRPSQHSGEELQEIIAHGTFPDLGGYWNGEERCWYLWEQPQVAPNWPVHTEAIRLAGGILEWVRPVPVNVNPSGRASFSWHFPN